MAGQFAVAGPGKQTTSPDGITWTNKGGAGSAGVCLVYSPELLLYVLGTGTQIYTTPDLITTTTRTDPFANFINGVAWSPTQGFAAGDVDGRVGTSPDGVTAWTDRGLVAGSNQIHAVEWISGLSLFAVGAAANARIHTSSDGASWSGNLLGLNSGGVQDFCWSDDLGLMVWVGNWSAQSRIETSTDGATFTPRSTSTPFGASTVLGCAWSSTLGLFCAVGQGGKIATSSDGGITDPWTARTSGVATDLNDVEWGPDAGVFVAVGNAGVLLSSPDGTNWTSRTSGFGATNINNVIWAAVPSGGWRVGMVTGG